MTTYRMVMLTAFVFLAVAFPTVSTAAEPGTTDYRGKVFLGVSGTPVELPADPRYESTHGMELTRVAAGSTGDVGGLRVGDILVSLDGESWTNDQIRLSRSFGKAGDKATPGETVAVRFLRQGEDGTDDSLVLREATVTLQRYPRTQPEADGAPPNARLRPDLVDTQLPYESLCRQVIERAGLAADCADLLARLERAEQVPDPDRLPLVRYVHRDPFKLEPVAREVAAPWMALSGSTRAALPGLLSRVQRDLLLFVPSGEAVSDGIPELNAAYVGTDLEGHLDYIEAVLKAAAERHKEAFADVSEEEVQSILDHRQDLIDSFIAHKMPSYDSDQARQRNSLLVLDLGVKVRLRPLFEQAQLAARLVEPDFTASLRVAAERSETDIQAPVIARRDTPVGTILIAGVGRNRYQDLPCAALYDLGGDDVYANNQGASVWGSMPTAVCVDYDGDDAYETYEPFQQGCGSLGVGFLVDLAGNDSYIGTSFTQGTGYLGIGVLIDESGNDTYRGIQLHQGVAQRGVGLLIDGGGQDRYEAHIASQGVGLAGGVGVLCDVGPQADSYYCKGNQGTGYGTPGVFEGWGQGMGIGFRPYASGGIGVLVDQGGADRMEVGNFGQGGGYFYAFGLLYAGGDGDDVYIGSRYAQGFGCHQAAGAMIETGGNDRYITRHAVAQGLSWDEAVGLFLEESGDDRYEGGSFSQGASAMNGWTLFIELAGKDTYLYTDQARAGGNTYHGGTSLSFFADFGGDDDHYPTRPNNSVETAGAWSVFADFPADLADVLERKVLDSLMPVEEQ